MITACNPTIADGVLVDPYPFGIDLRMFQEPVVVQLLGRDTSDVAMPVFAAVLAIAALGGWLAMGFARDLMWPIAILVGIAALYWIPLLFQDRRTKYWSLQIDVDAGHVVFTESLGNALVREDRVDIEECSWRLCRAELQGGRALSPLLVEWHYVLILQCASWRWVLCCVKSIAAVEHEMARLPATLRLKISKDSDSIRLIGNRRLW